MKSFVHWLLPQLIQVTEEYLTNHKSNFTGHSLYMQKDLRLTDAFFFALLSYHASIKNLHKLPVLNLLQAKVCILL